MPELPRGTVAFLFTDLEGSTRLWQAYPEAMPAAYDRHDAILRDAVARHGGVVFKVVGDALQTAFSSAPAATAAALDSQRALVAEPWAVVGLPESLCVRMALHVGAVDPEPDGDYRSPVLNRLGRLLAAGHGGQVLLSAAARELTRDRLPKDAVLSDLGMHRLPDLLEPEHIYDLRHPAFPSDFPPITTLDTRLHHLPIQPTPFLGRGQDTARAVDLLRREEVRLLTLTGPGGTGKTRLGLQVAAELVDAFPDGVFFVPLAPLTDPALVPSAIAEAVGVREAGGRALPELLGDALNPKRLLLLIDNFEQVAGAAPDVGALLAAVPGLKVLVTSRIPLRLRAEREQPVPPLPLPRRRPPPTAEQLTQYEAVRLFVERAQAVKPDFAVTDENAPAVAELCHRLDGLPLAIELAAARAKLLPPRAMLARLERRLPLLTGGAHDLPTRHQTLRGAIAWSYDLLSADEQKLYRRLAVFAGGWTIEAAEAVVGSPESGELGLDVFDGLCLLIDHSLARSVEGSAASDGPAGEARFGMLETIREYGLDRLAESGEADEAAERHARFFLALAEAAEPGLAAGTEQGAWLGRLEAELDNLRAALGWALARDPAAVLQLAATLSRFWLGRGYLSEGSSWLERALAGDGGAAETRVRALWAAGDLARERGDWATAVARNEASLALSREIGDARGVANALNGLGIVAMTMGDLDRAVALYEEILAITRETGDTARAASSTNNLGVTIAQQGDLDRAEALLSESLALYRGLGDTMWMRYALINLGEVALARGDRPRAARQLYETLTTTVELGMKDGVLALALAALGVAAGTGGRSEQAARLVGAADALIEAIGSVLDPVLPAELDRSVAGVRRALGEDAYVAAHAAGRALPLEEVIAEALALAEELGEGANAASVPPAPGSGG